MSVASVASDISVPSCSGTWKRKKKEEKTLNDGQIFQQEGRI